MTAADTDLRDWMEARSVEIAARLERHPDRAVLTVLGPLDVLALTLRRALDLRWTDGGELHARRADAISTHWFALADVDGVPDVGLCSRWIADLGLAPDGVTDDDRSHVAATLVGIAEREREQALRRWSVQTVEAALAGRYVQTRAASVRADGVLVGHLRADEPSAAAVAEQAERLAAVSPMNRRMSSAGDGPRWPVDSPITADSLRAECTLHGLLQRGEIVSDWAQVVQEIRALVAP